MPRRRVPEALLGALLLLVGSSAAAAQAPPEPAPAEKPVLAVFGTVPIYWGEGNGMEDVLAGTATPHWARALLEQGHVLQPLATLLGPDLAGHRALLIAQPRVLGPSENVALDQWVRAGGRLLLFADPLLSGESVYPLGDPRRPQDVVLLSPLLHHWGLDLQFDADQPSGRQVREIAGLLLPHQLSGALLMLSDNADCDVQGDGIIAECRIGKGKAVIVADAALLDLYHPAAGAGEAVLELARKAFDQPGIALLNNGLVEATGSQAVDKAVQNDP